MEERFCPRKRGAAAKRVWRNAPRLHVCFALLIVNTLHPCSVAEPSKLWGPDQMSSNVSRSDDATAANKPGYLAGISIVSKMNASSEAPADNVTAKPGHLEGIYIVSARINASSEVPARIGTVITIALKGLVGGSVEHGVTSGPCIVNHNNVNSTFVDADNGVYLFTYNVSAGDKDWSPGHLPLNCELRSSAGNTSHITRFTDQNTLSGDAHTPRFSDYHPEVLIVLGFIATVGVSHFLSKVAAWIGLPLVTGYLAAGVIAGPYALGLMPKSNIRSLRFVDEVCLAFIALTAGSKLRLETLNENGRTIASITAGLVMCEYTFGAGAVFLLSPYIEFMADMSARQVHSHVPSSRRVNLYYIQSSHYQTCPLRFLCQIAAVALLAGALLVARSPASAIAICKEIRASGTFTRIVLGVTVVMDLVVIELFAVGCGVCMLYILYRPVNFEFCF